jgi:hypothetical protein
MSRLVKYTDFEKLLLSVLNLLEELELLSGLEKPKNKQTRLKNKQTRVKIKQTKSKNKHVSQNS